MPSVFPLHQVSLLSSLSQCQSRFTKLSFPVVPNFTPRYPPSTIVFSTLSNTCISRPQQKVPSFCFIHEHIRNVRKTEFFYLRDIYLARKEDFCWMDMLLYCTVTACPSLHTQETDFQSFPSQ